MNKRLKKIIPAVLITIIVLSLTGVGIAAIAKDRRAETLVIYNWADYIEPEVLDLFEKYYEEKTGKDIKLIYSLFDTNETMITEVLKGDSQIDLVCPSEYAIQKLMQKGKLQKLDMSPADYRYIGNVYSAITDKVGNTFSSLKVNGANANMNDYFVPYMWGTLGILYNKNYITEDDLASGWGVLWNEKQNPALNGKILIKDSVRDIYVAALMYLKEYRLLPSEYETLPVGELINTVDETLLKLVEDSLLKQREYIKGYEVDFGKDDMIKEVAYADLAWSGDALWAMEESYSEETDDYALDYFVPEIGGNLWFDGWCVTTSAKNVPAAKMFIDFMCRPDIAMMNSMNIGYTCSVNPEVFLDVDDEINGKYSRDALINLIGWEYAWEIDDADKETDGIYVDLTIDGETKSYDFTEFFGDARRYPAMDDSLGVMRDFGVKNEQVVAMWEQIKGSDSSQWKLLVVFVVIVAVAAAAVSSIILIRNLKNRRRPSENN